MKVFLFPGQGSQRVGMGKDLAMTDEGRDVFQKANDILGYNLREVCVEGPGDVLQRTLYTQPALFVVCSLLAGAMEKEGITPDAVAGHSAGEYAALCAGGVFDFETGLRIVGRRAQLMEGAGKETGGAMAAVIGLDSGKVTEVVESYAGQGPLGVAAYNTSVQTVISGKRQLVEKAGAELKEAGARMVKMLPVSSAFHSELMRGASEKLAAFLSEIEFKKPRVPFVSNLTGKATEDPEEIRQGLSQLLLKPVRWTECLESLEQLGGDEYYELGPGNVLAGLLKKHNSEMKCTAIDSLASITKS
jgi:[acyl-carrier-protein] S-malonyltransferase